MDLRSSLTSSLALITMFLNALTIAKLYCKGKVYDVSKVFWTMVMTKNGSSKDNGDAGAVGQQQR